MVFRQKSVSKMEASHTNFSWFFLRLYVWWSTIFCNDLDLFYDLGLNKEKFRDMKKLTLLHADSLKDTLLDDSFFLDILIFLSISLIFLVYKYLKKWKG